ncbi:scarecrow-like protein 6 [Impatiens glandulifera]|uniref:scarecrow-like protein 6 n=1 Tax=Impatiens glandulifera TaxID=253017 RepID=UPI001FB0DC33|nr:scarecrow-like protein 6 [Impatiens glandulifera]
MPLETLDFEGKGVFVADSSSFLPFSNHWEKKNKKNKVSPGFGFGFGPTSILDSIGSPSPPTSTSTLSSSFLGGGGGGGAGSTDSAGVAAVSGKQSQKWPETSSSNIGAESGCGSGSSDLQHIPVGGGIIRPVTAEEKCGLGMEDWESVLSESAAASPSQEQSILRWIMGDMEDPSLGLNKLLQTGNGQAPDYDFSGGFGVVDQGFPSDSSGQAVATGSNSGGNLMGMNLPSNPQKSSNDKFGFAQNYMNLSNCKVPASQNPIFSPLPPGNLMPISLSTPAFNPPPQQPHQFNSSDVKPQVYNPNLIINQNQSHLLQNPSFFLPFNQQGQNLIMPPQAKRHNPGSGFDSILPHYQQQQQQKPAPPAMTGNMNMNSKPKGESENLVNQQNPPPQAIIDLLIKAGELIQTGNSLLAQGILARLNHQLSPIGKPFNRAAFYLKEALLSLLHGNSMNSATNNPLSLIFKIAAYKSLSEISPLLQFANFTSNQAILEALEGCDRIHIIDFDIGYGGQWSSLMQELSLRNGGSPSLRITAFSSPNNTHDRHHLELELTRENLNHFANEINMPFEIEFRALESLNSFHLSDHETIAVNLPIGSPFFNHIVLRFVKQLSPQIVVSMDRGLERTDLPFPHHLIHALQSNSNLLESIDAVNVNQDALQKIERYLIQPEIENIVWSRFQSIEKTPHWRTLLLSCGFSAVTFSNFAESQAECVLKRTPVRGFHVEKRQSSLVLCWQRKEIVSVSAWR